MLLYFPGILGMKGTLYFMLLYFPGILGMKGTLLCHACAFYFFTIQRHLCSNIGTTVC